VRGGGLIKPPEKGVVRGGGMRGSKKNYSKNKGVAGGVEGGWGRGMAGL